MSDERAKHPCDRAWLDQLMRESVQGFTAYCGFVPVSLEPGRFRARIELRPHHLQQDGFAHAGVMTTLADPNGVTLFVSPLYEVFVPVTATLPTITSTAGRKVTVWPWASMAARSRSRRRRGAAAPPG